MITMLKLSGYFAYKKIMDNQKEKITIEIIEKSGIIYNTATKKEYCRKMKKAVDKFWFWLYNVKTV